MQQWQSDFSAQEGVGSLIVVSDTLPLHIALMNHVKRGWKNHQNSTTQLEGVEHQAFFTVALRGTSAFSFVFSHASKKKICQIGTYFLQVTEEMYFCRKSKLIVRYMWCGQMGEHLQDNSQRLLTFYVNWKRLSKAVRQISQMEHSHGTYSWWDVLTCQEHFCQQREGEMWWHTATGGVARLKSWRALHSVPPLKLWYALISQLGVPKGGRICFFHVAGCQWVSGFRIVQRQTAWSPNWGNPNLV